MGSSSVASRATAALLGICKELGLEPAQQFRSLSLFADRYLPALGGRPLAAAGAAGVAAQPQLLLSAAACVLLVLEQEATGSEQWQQLSRVYIAAGRVLGADFEAEWQSSDLTAAAALVQQEAGLLERRQNAASFVEFFYQQIQQVGDWQCALAGMRGQGLLRPPPPAPDWAAAAWPPGGGAGRAQGLRQR